MTGAARAWLRAGLVGLALVEFTVGAWQALLPASFYNDIDWVARYPPFNDHLMRDLGGLNLALGVVLAGAALVLERRFVVTALLAFLMYSSSHVLFHATHTEHFTRAEATVQVLTLGVGVLIPLALLLLARRASDPAPDG
ncbi:hypothetical protein [Murinocardiopsis flavida]|uniref:hypothetical protein n=1 Tax=Murinocardiopsis flavida TaxID=645275 RepID=UPI000D0DBB77|nr:hypothetical protein [Murinocardiopsis flavida]